MSFDQFLAERRAFAREGVEYVLVGGVAVNIHGIIRTTEDIDLFVRPTEENVARIPAMLVRMKAGTVRPRDDADALLLRERFNLKDD